MRGGFPAAHDLKAFWMLSGPISLTFARHFVCRPIGNVECFTFKQRLATELPRPLCLLGLESLIQLGKGVPGSEEHRPPTAIKRCLLRNSCFHRSSVQKGIQNSYLLSSASTIANR